MLSYFSIFRDSKGVESVLSAMKSAGVPITHVTYLNLALPYAENGNVEKIIQVQFFNFRIFRLFSFITTCFFQISETMQEKNAPSWYEKEIFELVLALSSNGHSSKIDQ